MGFFDFLARLFGRRRPGPVTPPVPQDPIPPPPLPPVSPPLPGPGRVVKVTDASDGEFVNRGYAYWATAWIRPDGTVCVFAGHVDGRPRFFTVNLETGAVTRLGVLLLYKGTTEGWYWDRTGRIYLCDGPRLRRVNPFDLGDDVVMLDISETHPGCRLWQAHSSDDGQVHSATIQRIVEDGPYQNIGTVVRYRGVIEYFAVTPGFRLDESQVDRSGEYLVIKENDDNRIITLATGETRWLVDAEGAVGHSDCGDGIVVGEDNHLGACVYWDLRQSLTLDRRRALFPTWNMGYVSVRGGRCLHSDQTNLSMVDLNGNGETPIVAHGMTGDGYDFRVKANLDPTGQIACYLSNAAGRLDVYVVRV